MFVHRKKIPAYLSAFATNQTHKASMHKTETGIIENVTDFVCQVFLDNRCIFFLAI